MLRYITVLLVIFIFSLIKANELTIDSLKYKYQDIVKNGNDSLLYELCYEISYNSKKPSDKLKYSNLAYQYALKKDCKYWMAASKFLSAAPYLRRMELDSAIQTLLIAKNLYANINALKGVASCNTRLADIFKGNKEYSKAELYYKDAIDILSDLKFDKNIAISYMNLGELYRNTGKFSLALKYLQKSDSLFQKLNIDNYSAYCKGNIGLIYTSQNKLDSAEIHLNRSIETLRPLHDNYAVSSYLDGLAEIYFKRKQYKKAKLIAHKSFLLAFEYSLKEQTRDASLRLSSIYNQSKEFEKAFFYHKQYVAYRDSINNEEIIRKIANLRTKYEVAQKQKEVDEEKIQSEQLMIVSICLVSILFLFIIVIIILLKNSRLRKKTTLKLQQQRKDLETANATKNRFFSILSHDMRSPLATYHSFSELIELYAELKDYKNLTLISKQIQSSSANLLDLLDNLLQWGINQMDTHKSTPSNVSLKDIINEEIDHLMHVSDKKNITINVTTEKSIVYVDRVRLSIAFRNLLSNAIKFTPTGGNIYISTRKKEGYSILTITDSGVGMTPAQEDQLFNASEINSTFGTQNEKGVGLGLQLISEFAKNCNATIKVESELGIGTTFTLSFKNIE